MIKNKVRLLILISIILLLLSGCTVDKQTSKQVKYSVTQGSNYTDFVQNAGERIAFESLLTEHVNYYFENDKYNEEQKSDFINRVEVLRSFLENKCKVSFEKPLSVYVSNKNTLQGMDRKIFLNDLTVESVDVTVTFLQALSGNIANYGLCYGISCYINEKLYDASFVPNVSAEKLGQYYNSNENIALMDLTIPTFQTIYFSEEQNNYVYSTAYCFVNDLIERKGLKYSINLLINSAKLDLAFDTKYTKEKNIWLKRIGASQKCEVPAIPIRYQLMLGNKKAQIYPYAVYTPSTISYFKLGKYTEEKKSDFINKVQDICTSLENELEISFEEPLSIYVNDENLFKGKDKELYLNDLNINSMDYINAILQSISGTNANYGLCYGISCYVNEKLYGTSLTPNISTKELGQYYSVKENLSILDLTIPTFQTVYFSEEQNNYASSTAYYFVKDLIERKGLEYSIYLLKNSIKLDIDFDIEYTNEKNIWLENIGASEKCEVPSLPMRYELVLEERAKLYPYAVYTPSTISYFSPNNEKFEQEGNIMDYDYIKHYLNIYEQDIAALKEYLAPYFDTEKDVINCYFGDLQAGGYYRYNGSIQYAAPLYAGVHEYAHYITFDNPNNHIITWLSEGIAEYCACYLENEDVYRMKKEYYDDHVDYACMRLYDINLTDANENISNSYLRFDNELTAYLYNNDSTNIRTLAQVYRMETEEEEGSDLTYSESGSLVNYLIEVYGWDKFIKLFEDYSKLSEIYDKTFDELKNEWQTQLNQLIYSLNFEYILGPNELKIAFYDSSDAYIPSKRSFTEILSGNTYEYVYCGSGRNKDDDEDPEANDFEGLDVKGKIALIEQREIEDILSFYKQVNNAAKAGAIGVIAYSDLSIYSNIYGVTYDIPAVSISMKDGELLKEALDKKITVNKDFIGVIDDIYFDN